MPSESFLPPEIQLPWTQSRSQGHCGDHMPQQSDEELSEQIQDSNPEFTNLTYRHAINFKLACKHSQTLNPEPWTTNGARQENLLLLSSKITERPNLQHDEKTKRLTFFDALLNPSCGTQLPDQRGKVADCWNTTLQSIIADSSTGQISILCTKIHWKSILLLASKLQWFGNHK